MKGVGRCGGVFYLSEPLGGQEVLLSVYSSLQNLVNDKPDATVVVDAEAVVTAVMTSTWADEPKPMWEEDPFK